MTNDYQSLIHLNPIIPYAMNGFAKSHWCNVTVLSAASIKTFQIDVYANTSSDATFYANQLKQYIEQNPMINRGGAADDISIGLRAPILDHVSRAYKVSMIMNTGMLMMINTAPPPIPATTNMCWTQLTNTSGTIYGGDIEPEYTSDGTLIYNVQFDTSDGAFIMQFGDAGDEKLTNSSLIVFEYDDDKVDLNWDSTNEYYTGTNSTLATAIALEVGTKVCFMGAAAPDEILDIDHLTEIDYD